MDKILLRLLATSYGKNLVTLVITSLFTLVIVGGWVFANYAERKDTQLEQLRAQMVEGERRCAQMQDQIRREQLEELNNALARMSVLERKYKAKK